MDDIKMMLTPADLEVIGDALTGYGADKRLIMKFSMMESVGGDISMISSCGDVEDGYGPLPTPDTETVRPLEVDSKIAMWTTDVEAPASDESQTPEVGPQRPTADEPLMEIKIGVGRDVEEKVEDTVGGWDSRVPRPTKYIEPEVIKTTEVTTPVITEEMQEKAAQLVKEMGVEPYPVNPKPPAPPKPPVAPGTRDLSGRRVRVPKPVEPSFDHDERCGGCGGFTQNNPHSDVKMNCNCVEEALPEPTPEPAQHDGGTTWNTGDSQVWRT